LPSPISTPLPRSQSSTLGSRRSRRSRATRTSLDRPRATTRRGKRIALSTWWIGDDATCSARQSQMNLKASRIAFASSTPRERTRPETVTNSKVSQMRFSRPQSSQGGQLYLWWSRVIRVKGKHKLTVWGSWRSHPPTPST
jgi:hypothetical protein